MTKNEQQVMALANQSIPFIIGEIRGFGAESVNYTSKKDGQAATFAFLSIPCERVDGSGKQFSVQMDIPKEYEAVKMGEGREAPVELRIKGGVERVQPFYKRGSKAIFVVSEYVTVKGITTIRASSVTILDEKGA